MGTTCIHVDPYYKNNPKKCFEIYNKTYLGEFVKTQDNGFRFEIVDYSVSFGSYFAVFKRTDPEGKEIWYLMCGLTSWNSSDFYNYGVKEIEVSGGPYNIKCPKRLVQLVEKHNPKYFKTGYALGWYESWKTQFKKVG